MDTHLVKITDLVKDYAEIIDELREKNDLIRSESIKNYCEEVLELRRRHENQVETIKILQDRNRDLSKLNIHKDSSFWKQREELKEENRALRQALSDIAANLGNGSTVSVEASLPFIKELPQETL